MTTITGDVGVAWGIAPAAAGAGKSYVQARPAEIVNTDTGVTLLPYSHRVELASDGSWELSMAPLPEGFAYVFEFVIDNGRYVSPPRFVRIPLAGTVAYKDLEDVVPPTGGGFAPPAWLKSVTDARDETLAAASGVVLLQDETIAGRIDDDDSETNRVLKANFVVVRTSDGYPLPPDTLVVVTINKTLAQVVAKATVDIENLSFEEA